MKPETYKAAIYREAGNIELVEKPYPDTCGDNDIIVKNLYATICGADYVAYKQDGDAQMIWKDYEFGHEMVSEIVEIGKNVKGLEVGDWVFPNLGYAYRDHHRMATVGGFSEYLYLPNIDLEDVQPSVIKLDKSLGFKNLCLFEPFVVGTRAAEDLNAKGKTAIVIGSGFIGMSVAIMLKYFGCTKVMMIDFSDFRLQNAREFGLLTCNPKNEDLKARAIEEFGSRRCYGGEKCGADIYVDAIGIQPCIDYFEQLGCYGATFSIVGVHHKPGQFNMPSITYNNQIIKGCGKIPLVDAFKILTEMLKTTEIDISKLISHEFSLDEIEEALITHGKFDIAQKVAIKY